MTITSLVENTSDKGFAVEHGLSLHIQSLNHSILFDMGQGTLFASNAEQLGVSIRDIDTAIVSHGHYDHGGGLATFLSCNPDSRVYIHREAFQPHYSLRDDGLHYIGLDASLQENSRLVLCADETQIDEQLTLFANVTGIAFQPHGNYLLYGPDKRSKDSFGHEQNLVIVDPEKVVLFAGCAHRGMINIMRRATEVIGRTPTHVFGGMHLVKCGLSPTAEKEFIRNLANELLTFPNCQFITMHCTGIEQYQLLKEYMGDRISYLSCGESINI